MESDARAEALRRLMAWELPDDYEACFVEGAEWRESRVKALEAALDSMRTGYHIADQHRASIDDCPDQVCVEWRALTNPRPAESPQASGEDDAR